MARPSTIVHHPKRQEIEAALARNEPLRSISGMYGVSVTALHRYRHAPRPAGPDPAAERAPVRRISETLPPRRDPFDLAGNGYPYEPGETRQADQLAAHLRHVNRKFGREATRALVQEALLQYDLAGLPTEAIARKFDVHPATVRRWREALKEDLRKRLDFDPQDMVAGQLANLDQMAKMAWQKLLATNPTGREWSTAMRVLVMVDRSRAELMERTGMADRLRLPPPEPQDDARGLGMVASLKGSLASFMVAAGIDPGASFDEAIDELPDVLDQNLGPVGSPEREETARLISRRRHGGADDQLARLIPAEPD